MEANIQKSNSTNLLKLYAIAFFGNNYFDRAIWMIYFGFLGFSVIQIAILQAILNATQFLSEIPTGLISDKYGRKASLFVGRVLIISYMLGFMIFHEFYMIAIFQILYGIGLTCLSGSDQALLYDSLKENQQERNYGKVVGRYFAITIAALAISMSIGGMLQGISWSYVYLAGVICQTIALFCTFTLKESTEVSTSKKRTFSDILKDIKEFLNINPKLKAYIIGIGIFYAIGSVYYMYNQQLFKEFGMPTYIISLLFAIDSVTTAIVSLNAYRLENKFTAKLVISTSLNIAILLFLVLFTKAQIWVLISFFGVSIIYNTLEPIASNVLNKEVESNKRATMISMTKFLSTFIMFISFPLIALLTKVLSIYFVLAIIGAITMWASKYFLKSFFRAKEVESSIPLSDGVKALK
ncbi:MFS family permease [Priestia megaterium]